MICGLKTEIFAYPLLRFLKIQFEEFAEKKEKSAYIILRNAVEE